MEFLNLTDADFTVAAKQRERSKEQQEMDAVVKASYDEGLPKGIVVAAVDGNTKELDEVTKLVKSAGRFHNVSIKFGDLKRHPSKKGHVVVSFRAVTIKRRTSQGLSIEVAE